ncbi:DUF937 domain-containing protein [Propioniciclava sp. MC1683]|uniref:DUF937 domain-containing protein n=1 Tax=Propioniciclava sp. MC1683 TaxID=2760309 RepID=UPI001C71E6EF|nr:DUF937 domain-containing protein [Propioniciclava sp. MC1683]
MAAVDDIKSSLDLSQIAQYLGTDEQTANEAVDQALAQLVGAMDDNATDAASAVGLSRAALNDHLEGSAFGDSIDINAVDAADGEKIVSHVFSPTQIQSLGPGMGGNLLRRLLPLLAPLVMGYLASKLQEKMGGGGRAQAPSQGGGLGDILGDLLGGGAPQQQSGSAGGGLGDILGDLLGGGAPQQPTQAPSSGGTGGFQAPTSDGGLRIDPGTSAPRQSQPQSPMGGGAGDLLGGLLKEILIGRR